MRRRERKSLLSMMSLYLNYIFQKTTLVIFIISLILMAIVLGLLSNPWMDKDSYLLSPEAFHQAYFQQSIVIIQIFNGILIATVVISLCLQASSFDVLFIANNKRTFLCTAKLLACVLLFLTLDMLEFIMLYIYPIFIYSEFKLEYSHLMTIPILFITMLVECSLSLSLTNLIPSIFTPMAILFLDIVKIILSSSIKKIRDILESVWIIVRCDNSTITMNSFVIAPILILILLMLYYSIYSIKDLHTT